MKILNLNIRKKNYKRSEKDLFMQWKSINGIKHFKICLREKKRSYMKMKRENRTLEMGV